MYRYIASKQKELKGGEGFLPFATQKNMERKNFSKFNNCCGGTVVLRSGRPNFRKEVGWFENGFCDQIAPSLLPFSTQVYN